MRWKEKRFYKLLFSVFAAVDFNQGSDFGTGTEDEVNTVPFQLHRGRAVSAFIRSLFPFNCSHGGVDMSEKIGRSIILTPPGVLFESRYGIIIAN